MTHDERSLLVRAQFVVPVSGEVLRSGWMLIEGTRIRAIGDGPAPAADGSMDFGEAALLPGLVNAHTHLGCAFLKGIPEGNNFASWISESVAPAVIRGVSEEPMRVREAAFSAAEELLQGGVTTVADSFFETVGRDALVATGQRGVFFREYFGAMSPSIEEAVVGAQKQAKADALSFESESKVGYGLAPHAPYTCPSAVLEFLTGEAEARGLRQTIHVAESADEMAFFCESSGPFMEAFGQGGRAARYALGQTPIAALFSLGCLGPHTLAVHCVHVDAADIVILADTKTHVVHCPSSNLRLATGISPIAEMLRAGINIALGTDSPASTGKLDLFEEMRLSVLLQRGVTGRVDSLSPEEALRMATLNGARALGMDSEVGSLDAGKLADFCVVDLSRSRHRPLHDPVTALVMSATPDDVIATAISGRVVFNRTSER